MDRLTKPGTLDGKEAIKIGSTIYVGEQNPSLFTALNKLAHYEDLEEQGRLIELPCKVGDTVYAIEGNDIVKNKVTEIWFNTDGRYVFTKEVIGKTVFPTKEEAEAKLAELKEKGEMK